MCTDNELLHPFEARGLGKAPFRITGWFRDVGPHHLANGMTVGYEGQPMGSCDYCGTGIAICVQVIAADGNQFLVGCDCAEKVGCDVKFVRKEIRDEAANAKREAARLQRVAKRNAELQAERDRNGGLTSREVEQQERAERAAVASAANGWLIDALNCVPYQSSFIESMISQLGRGPVADLSDRQVGILADILAKLAGRRGSKLYKAAYTEFFKKIENMNKSDLV